MKKHKLSERIKYWFDSNFERGIKRRVLMLLVATIVLILITTGLSFLLGGEEDALDAIWNKMVTVINAWMPEAGDGEEFPSIIATAIAAIGGLLITSILIGIISTGLEEKIDEIRNGNSRVIESGHIVILGFTPGEYKMIEQVVLAYEAKGKHIIIASDMERDEMDRLLSENLEIPKTVRIITRNADITDAKSLSCCALEDSQAVIINSFDDGTVIRSLLAVSKIIGESDHKITVVADIDRAENSIPTDVLNENMILLNTGAVIARLIAHSCTQPGLSGIFTDIFNFEGSEFYLNEDRSLNGRTFADLAENLDGAIPVGYERGGRLTLCPRGNEELKADDRFLYFAEKRNGYCLREDIEDSKTLNPVRKNFGFKGAVLVIGLNDVFGTVLSEMPEDVHRISFLPLCEEDRERAEAYVSEAGAVLDILPVSDVGMESLSKAVTGVDHVVLLNNDDLENDEADLEIMKTILNLRSLKARNGLAFSITAEMKSEHNRELIMSSDSTDFIVASDMSSMIMAQVALNPDIRDLLHELTSNEGSDIVLLPAEAFGFNGVEHTVSELRSIAEASGAVFLGYVLNDRDKADTHINPPISETVTLNDRDGVIVISK
ncbi:MAG: hypothetical protein MJ059_05445 [Lachnospiraceae bacterium]|nr:hypothetical protein [Lachnospiraceae bacterium]